MMYTVKQVSERINISSHTIRYYTDLGLIPNLKRDSSGRRIFDETSIDWLKGIIYLRELGMSLEDIKKYEQLCMTDGDEAIAERLHIIQKQIQIAENELKIAKERLSYLQKKEIDTRKILNHEIDDIKNPAYK